MMIRLLTKVMLLACVLLTAVICFIRFQPRDDTPLRAVLAPEECAPPCLMGIYPGQTTLQEAVELLNKNPWVKAIRRADFDREWIIFEWSGQQPKQFDIRDWVTVQGQDGLVQSITVPTHIPLSDFWLVAGKPDWAFGNELAFGAGTGYAIGYSNPGISAEFNSPYPNRLKNMLSLNVTLYYTVRTPTRFYSSPSLRDFVTGRAKNPT